MGHLRELRNRIVKAALAIIVGMVLGFVFFGPIWAVVTHPFCSAVISGHTGCKTQGDQLVVTGIFDPFMVRVQVAFFVGLIATSPVWLYQLWAFIAPGLYAREKRWTYLFVGAAVPLFAGGAASLTPMGPKDPSVWDEVVGQEPAVAVLSHAATHRDAMTHAWLLTGPPGSGRSISVSFTPSRRSTPSARCTSATCSPANGSSRARRRSSTPSSVTCAPRRA